MSGTPDDKERNRRGVSNVAVMTALLTLLGASVIGVFILNRSESVEQATSTSTTSTTEPAATSTTSTTEPAAVVSAATEQPPPLISGDYADEAIDVWLFDGTVARDIMGFTDDYFTAMGGAQVNFRFYDEENTTPRSLAANILDFSNETTVLMIDRFAARGFGENGWLWPFSGSEQGSLGGGEAEEDFVPTVREDLSAVGDLWALPIHASTSIMMFNQDAMSAAGVVVPSDPTWDDIETLAAQLHNDEIAGICIQSVPTASTESSGALPVDTGEIPSLTVQVPATHEGLHEPLSAMVDAFGGSWWETNEDGTPGEPQINQPNSGFRQAADFLVRLLRDFGPQDAANLTFEDCFELFANGQVAMWFDSSDVPNLLNERDAIVSPRAGNFAAAAAPVGPTGIRSDFLDTWGLSVWVATAQPDAAGEFVRWVSSPDFAQLVARDVGWEAVPPTRESTLTNNEYQRTTEPWGPIAFDTFATTKPDNQGFAPAPDAFPDQIWEFPQIATDCAREISAAIAQTATVDAALDACQTIAAEIS